MKGRGSEERRGARGEGRVSVRGDAGEGRHWGNGILVRQVCIPESTMMLGGKVKVNLPAGRGGVVSVAGNSQPGDRRRMSKAGYLQGDLDLEFILDEQEELTSEQIEVLERLRDVGL